MRQAMVLFGVCVISFVAVGLAQQAPPPATPQTPIFRAATNTVELDVSVLDKDRKPVEGLRASEFTILEDGKPQTITAFSAVTVPDAVDSPVTWLRDVGPDVQANIGGTEGRIIAIVIDDATMTYDSRAVENVKKIGHAVVDQLSPGDLACVIFTADNRAAQGFTNDHGRLLAAIDKTKGGWETAIPSAQFPRYAVNTLRSVATYLGDVPLRRKSIIYISSGVNMDLSQTSATLGSSTTTGGSGRGARGASVRNSMGPREDALALRDQVNLIFTEASKANVSIYPIDPFGLAVDISPKIEFLNTLAENTGGLATLNRNDVDGSVTQILHENAAYYLLGFVSTNSKEDGSLRQISVRVSRPGLTVRARSGYTATKAVPASAAGGRAGAPSRGMMAALAGVLPKADLGMQVQATPFATGTKKAAIAVVVALRQSAPASGGSRVDEHSDVQIAAYDDKNKRQDPKRESVQLVLRSEPGGQVQYEILEELLLDPGHYELRVAGDSALQGKQGSVYQDIDVPDFTKAALSLSGVLLSATPAVASAPKDKLVGLVPVVPTTRRQFTTSDQVTAFLRVYQGGKNKLVLVPLHVTIINSADTTVFDQTATLGADQFSGPARAADERVDLPVSRLPIGPYLLKFEATVGKSTVERDVRFVVGR